MNEQEFECRYCLQVGGEYIGRDEMGFDACTKCGKIKDGSIIRLKGYNPNANGYTNKDELFFSPEGSTPN